MAASLGLQTNMPIDSQSILRKIVRNTVSDAKLCLLHHISMLIQTPIITATELNRQPGTVLDKASTHPVTITRGDRAFAL